MEFYLPEAVLKLKQGFGRLIRTKSDTGMVAILDPRVFTKPYGRMFLDSLPDCERVVASYRDEAAAHSSQEIDLRDREVDHDTGHVDEGGHERA
jgi:Rad3-related DNA helicase